MEKAKWKIVALIYSCIKKRDYLDMIQGRGMMKVKGQRQQMILDGLELLDTELDRQLKIKGVDTDNNERFKRFDERPQQGGRRRKDRPDRRGRNLKPGPIGDMRRKLGLGTGCKAEPIE